jgi:peptidoglycan hydrolase-like protein with peptidoglycan-binding domain
MRSRTLGVVALALLAAACGTNREDRVTGGAATGAAAGAGVGALGGPPGMLAGAAIGGGVGAVTGATTDANQVNLGEPVWNDPNVRVPGVTGSGSRGSAQASGQTRDLQRALSQRGFDPGPVDGIYGPRTRQAVMDWQRQNNMQVTGQPNSQMLADLGVSSRGGSSSAQRDVNRAYMGGGMVGDDRSRSGTTGSTDMRTGSGNVTPGTTGGGAGMERPNPSNTTGSGAIPAPSNNPMNDPTGGASSATRPGLNQNRQ